MKVYLREKAQTAQYRTYTTFLSGTDLVKHLHKFTLITAGHKIKTLPSCGITFGECWQGDTTQSSTTFWLRDIRNLHQTGASDLSNKERGKRSFHHYLILRGQSRIPRQWTRLSRLDCTTAQYWSQRTIGWVTSVYISRRFHIWRLIITSDLIKPFQGQCFVNSIFHLRKRLLTFLKLTGTCRKRTVYLLLLHLKASAMKGPNTCSKKSVSFVVQEPKTLLLLKSIELRLNCKRTRFLLILNHTHAMFVNRGCY